MTVQEAIEYLKEKYFQDYNGTPYDMAIEALEKQIPKKPFDVKRIPTQGLQGKCSVCGGCSHRTRYCQRCGQKLDWDSFVDIRFEPNLKRRTFK